MSKQNIMLFFCGLLSGGWFFFLIYEIKTYMFKLFQRFLTELNMLLLFHVTKMRTAGCVEIQKVT